MVKTIPEHFEFLQNLVFRCHEGNRHTSDVVINKSDKLECIVSTCVLNGP
jgi:hypothetical protein